MRVAIYSRVSTAGQKEEGFSLQDQERRLRMFCQQKGYEVIDHYSDDKSGKSFQRPEFQRFLKEIKPKKNFIVHCVLECHTSFFHFIKINLPKVRLLSS